MASGGANDDTVSGGLVAMESVMKVVEKEMRR